MKLRRTLLQTMAAGLWGTTLITAFTGWDDRPEFTALDGRLWLCTLGITLISTWAVLQRQIVARFSRSNQALANAVLTRPVNGARPELIEVTGPHATVSLPAVAPPVQLGARRKHPAPHATRR